MMTKSELLLSEQGEQNNICTSANLWLHSRSMEMEPVGDGATAYMMELPRHIMN
jgi:hypothetical protein